LNKTGLSKTSERSAVPKISYFSGTQFIGDLNQEIKKKPPHFAV
jgi:hypothetical protein